MPVEILYLFPVLVTDGVLFARTTLIFWMLVLFVVSWAILQTTFKFIEMQLSENGEAKYG
jgi:hypothetical protein